MPARLASSVRIPATPAARRALGALALTAAAACGNNGGGGEAPYAAEAPRVHTPGATLPTASTSERAVLRVATTRASMSARGEVAALGHDLAAVADEVRTGPPVALPDLQAAVPPTPTPTYWFNTGNTTATRISIGGSPADAGIAASATHLCVTARGAFACYTKSGLLVALGEGFAARPYTAREFFEQSGIAPQMVADGATNNFAKDGRVVFEPVSRRFFVVFQSRETVPRLLIAVSRSQDPRDGWFTYADNVQSGDVNGHDYMWVGVNSTHLLVSNIMLECPMVGSCGSARTRHFSYELPELLAGQAGYVRGEWQHSDANRAVPAVHQTPTADAFYVHRDDDTHVTVWAVRAGTVSRRTVTVQSSSPAVDGLCRNDAEPSGSSEIVYTNIGRAPQNADFRDGRLSFVSNDGRVWSGQPTARNAVRYVRLNVAAYFSGVVSVDRDRIFGRASEGDPADAVFDYGWPAIATNAANDAVIGTVRSNSETFPSLRASVWFNDESDVSTSVQLRHGLGPLRSWHMAGAAADPSGQGVYVAQQWPTGGSPSWRIHVARMLGGARPDLITTNVTAPASATRGTTITVTLTIANEGDASMPVGSTGELRLSSNNLVSTADTLLESFTLPLVYATQSNTVSVPVTIPGRIAPGTYFLGARLDTGGTAVEHSEANNTNPFLGGDHGNRSIVIN